MKKTPFFVACLLIISCSNSPLVSPLEGSDSLSIRFTRPQDASQTHVVSTTKPGAIKALLVYIDGSHTEQFKCGYDGNILFYKNGSLAGEVSFNYVADNCRHFLHQNGDQLVATKMSNEAVDFLKALADQPE
jgi:hypothetical protein